MKNSSRNPLDSALSVLLPQIYACSTNPEMWSNSVEIIRSTFNAAHCNFFSIAKSDYKFDSLVGGSGMEDHWVESYLEYYSEIDIWNKKFHDSSLKPGQLLHSGKDFTKKELGLDEYYADFWLPQGLHETMGFLVQDNESYLSQLGISAGDKNRRFNPEEIRLFNSLYPHVKRSIEITNQLYSATKENGLLGNSLNSLRNGLVVLDSTSNIVFSNSSFMDLIQRTGIIRTRDSRLEFTSRSIRGRLESLIDKALKNDLEKGQEVCSGGVFIRLDSHERLLILVTPLRASNRYNLNFGNSTGAAVFFISSHPKQSSAKLLAEILDLPNRQAELLDLIISGQSLSEAAIKMGVSRETAKSHLSSVFDKMSINSQLEIRLLAENLRLHT